MAIQTLTLNFPNVNVSAQLGDLVYYSIPSTSGGFNTSSIPVTFAFGVIIAITTTFITVEYEDATVSPPPTGSFIFFQKDKKVNMSSILGYYMQVDFVNDSKEKAELFSVGSEVSESSK
tara:strand:+ start:2672 stop:3028 length:357 start_codon:yes stop_codon:yes gene_type:complete